MPAHRRHKPYKPQTTHDDLSTLEHTIRHALTHYAPDEPGWNIIKRWAGDVFKATPVGAAIDATHELINHYAEFFSDLATLLSDLSGTIGILSLPLMFVPGIAPAVAVAALSSRGCRARRRWRLSRRLRGVCRCGSK